MKLYKKIFIGCMGILLAGTLAGCQPSKSNTQAWYGNPHHSQVKKHVKNDIVANLGKSGEVAYSSFKYNKKTNTEYVTLSKKALDDIHQAQQPSFLTNLNSAKAYLKKNKNKLSEDLGSDSTAKRKNAENAIKPYTKSIVKANNIANTKPLLIWVLHEDRSKVQMQDNSTPRILITNLPSGSVKANEIINSSGLSKKHIITNQYKKINNETGMTLLRSILQNDPLINNSNSNND